MEFAPQQNMKNMSLPGKSKFYPFLIFVLIIIANFFLPLERSNLKLNIKGTDVGLNIILTLVVFSFLFFNKTFQINIKKYIATKLFRDEIYFVGAMLISLFFSLAEISFGIHLIILYIGAYILLVIIFLYCINMLGEKVLLKMLSIVSILFAMIGIIEIFVNYTIPFYYNLYSDYFQENYDFFMQSRIRRANGSLGHPLLYSNMLLLIFPLIWINKSHFMKMLSSIFIIVGILAGNSRTSIFLLGFILLIYFAKTKLSYRLFLISVAVTTVFFIMNTYQLVFDAIFIRVLDFGVDSSSLGRAIWIAAGFSRLNHQDLIYTIFGNGVGASKEVLFKEIYTLWPTFDNNYMMLAITIGILGLTFYIIKYIRLLISLSQNKEDDLFWGVILFLLIGFSFDTLHYSGIIVPHSFLVALAINRKAIT